MTEKYKAPYATRNGKPAYHNAPPRLRASDLPKLFVPDEPPARRWWHYPR